jgi:hypothetical protein
VSALGKDDAERAKVTVDAVYDGSNGRVAGSLGLVAGNALITPFTGQQPLPEIAETATGTFSFTSSTGNFDLDLANDVALSALGNVLGANPELPTTLHVRSAITLAGHPARIAVTRFEHSIAPNNAVPVLQARISNPLLFEPAHPEALLATPQALGVVTHRSADLLGESARAHQASPGRLALDCQADICVFDPAAVWRVGPQTLRSQGKHTLFEGYELPGQVLHTVVGGRLVFSADPAP